MIYDIIVAPILTEKSQADISEKRYTFKVVPSATKTEIKNAVERIFGVSVESVNTVNVKGKMKRMGRNEGRTAKYKKAIVQLTADSKAIEFFDSLS